MDDYQVIAINLKKVEKALQQKWPKKLDYIIMRQFIGTKDDPPRPCYGDAFVIKGALISHGCVCGKDFYIRKAR